MKPTHICMHSPRIELRYPSEFKSLMNLFSISELSFDLQSTACLMHSITFYHQLLGYVGLLFIMLAVMALPTLWARFYKTRGKMNELLNLFLIWALILMNLIYPSVRFPCLVFVPFLVFCLDVLDSCYGDQ